jgi:hypothetical protein
LYPVEFETPSIRHAAFGGTTRGVFDPVRSKRERPVLAIDILISANGRD